MCYTSTNALFEDQSYPTTARDLIDSHGEETLELAGGSQTVGEALEIAGDESFESAEEARHAVYAGLGSQAIGRKGYSDRDPDPPGTDGNVPVSF
ncbi:DUF5789 family protein [Halalkalicoccus tibetensis]|uniref:DUF2795 domain-containing protein n=1 Tax=Halalkalicoccus tibetensis TaxID=175632 RepID=A0ABD5V593_9EURY